MADLEPCSTSQTCGTPVAHTTQSGKRSREWESRSDRVTSTLNRLTLCLRLPVGELQIRKDQRSACNRWNKFVLGDDYVKEAAKLHPKSKGEKQRQRNVFDLEEAIHGAEYNKLPSKPAPEHNFEVTIESAGYTDEKHQLYVNYQTNVHGEPESKSDKAGFKRFLCDTPLVFQTESINGTDRMLGSVHQCYRLDGRLIAMGVLDLLPSGVSAVYFMYHSDFEKWSFGKLSALREACLARENGHEFYYMGYYIHSCGKMRYKNDFQPQYFLDLEDKNWVSLDTLLPGRTVLGGQIFTFRHEFRGHVICGHNTALSRLHKD
jgi:arginine-tRNA-protein transferase